MKLHIVPASTGLLWVRQGIRVFWRQPMALTLLFFGAMATMSLLTLLPFIGAALALALLPSLTLTLMVAATEANQGRTPMPSLLLVAFRAGRARLSAMLTLGGLYAAGFLLVIALSTLVDDGSFARVYLGGEPLTREIAASGAFQGAMWLMLLLYLPLSLLFWHAPGLVYWHQVPPAKALFFSIVACWRNLGAFFLYGLAWMGVFLATGMVLSLVIALLSFAGLGPGFAGGAMVAGALALATMLFTSVVFTFRDCFGPPQQDEAGTGAAIP